MPCFFGGSMINNIALRGQGMSVSGNARFTIPSLPSNFHNSGTTTLTRDDIEQKIRDIARRNMEKHDSSRDMFDAHIPEINTLFDAEYAELKRAWTSLVSPDRQSIVNNRMSEISSRIGSIISQGKQTINLFNLLFSKLSRPNHNFNFASGVHSNIDQGSNFINFRDANGNLVACYTAGEGWREHFTDAEWAATGEFHRMWNDIAIEFQTKNKNTNTIIDLKNSGHNIDVADLKSRGIPLDMYRLASNGIHVNTETGETYLSRDIQNKSNTARVVAAYSQFLG